MPAIPMILRLFCVCKNPPANAGDIGSISDPGGSHMPQSSWARVPTTVSSGPGIILGTLWSLDPCLFRGEQLSLSGMPPTPLLSDKLLSHL